MLTTYDSLSAAMFLYQLTSFRLAALLPYQSPVWPLSLYSNVISFIKSSLNTLLRTLSPAIPQHVVCYPNTPPTPLLYCSHVSANHECSLPEIEAMCILATLSFSRCTFSVNAGEADCCRDWRGSNTYFRLFLQCTCNLYVSNLEIRWPCEPGQLGSG